MKKIVAGLLALLLVAVVGYFTFGRFATTRVESDVTAAFAALKEKGVEASYRSLAVDAASRGVTVSGLSIATADGTRIAVDKLTATGASPVNDGRFTADTLDLEGLTVRAPGALPGAKVAVDVPKVMIDRYVGPIALARDLAAQPAAATAAPNPYGPLRAILLQFAATGAAKVTIPELTARVDQAADAARPSVSFATTDLAAEGVEYGKIRSLIVDKIAFTTEGKAAGADAPVTAKGEVNGLVAALIDTAPMLAVTGGSAAGDQYQEVYGKVVSASYKITRSDGVTGSSGPMVLEHMGIKPAAFAPEQMARLDQLALKGGDLSLDEAREVLKATATMLDGLAFTSFSVTNGMSKDGDETVTFASAVLDGYAAGLLDGLTLTGVSGTNTDKEPVKMNRLAVRQLSLHQLASLADLAEEPSASGALGLFRLFSAIEAEGLEMPYDSEGPGAAGTAKVGHFALSWSHFAGNLPTRMAVTLQDATGPIHASDGEPYVYLANAGMTSATLNLDFSMAYDPDAKALTVAPAGMRVDNAFSVAFEGGLGNLPKSMFDDEAAAMDALGKASARPFKLTLTDLGLAKLMLDQLSAASNTTPDALRQELLANIDAMVAALAPAVPEAPAVGEVVKTFVKNPTSITLTGTPRSDQPVAPLLMSDEPLAALSLFKLSAEVAPDKAKPAP